MKNRIYLTLFLGLLLIAVCSFLACERKCNCVYPEEHIADYHMLYSPGRIAVDEGPFWTLIYSTKTGEVVDSIVSDLLIQDIRFTSDGTMAAVRAWGDAVSDEEKYIFTLNYPTMDTIAFRSGYPGWSVLFSPDELEILLCNGRSLAIFTFPSLDSIYVEYVANSGGGFLTSGDSIFYFLAGVDTLYVVDYSNRQNIVKTPQPVKSVNLPVYPSSAAVDYQEERIILYSNYSEIWASHIKVLNSNDLSQIRILDIKKQYNNGGPSSSTNYPVIRPGTDEVYFCNNLYGIDGYDYIDMYNAEYNILMPFLHGDDIVTFDDFKPQHIEFTPDGEIAYVLLGGGLTHSLVLGFRMLDNSLIQVLRPDTAYANFLRIYPIAYSN